MRLTSLLTGLGYAVLVILLTLAVIVPVFIVVNWVYDSGRHLVLLMIVIIAAWFLLAVLLARRKIAL